MKILSIDIIEGNLEFYKKLLDTTNQATDLVWKGILSMYIDFSREEKEVFLKFLRVIEINTLSHVLGILDGSTFVEGIKDDFVLTTEENNEKINENLQ
ncbi:hypothetical protein [Chryseobacterium sp. SIMBA_029]|uniref:hypothetical protein n=1 Tax=Chryseobacterium sp. SIMBA_029 TaxID=3085772 RepID=UPI00397CB420